MSRKRVAVVLAGGGPLDLAAGRGAVPFGAIACAGSFVHAATHVHVATRGLP